MNLFFCRSNIKLWQNAKKKGNREINKKYWENRKVYRVLKDDSVSF